MALDQSFRRLEIQTPLGDHVVGLRAIHVKEKLSEGFTIEADLVSEGSISLDDLVGHPVAVRLDMANDEPRFWHALVARCSLVTASPTHSYFRALLVPWSWALTRSGDCRIFQKLSVPDIVQKVFRDRGAKDFELRLSGSYPVHDYCVQYRETDFAFVHRLLEREGITYYFKHDKDKGQLVLADEKASYDHAAYGSLDYKALYYRPGEDSLRHDSVTAWALMHEVETTEFALTDYNPLKPKESLLRTSKIGRKYGLNDRQRFDFPGNFDSAAEAERVSRIRLDELQAGHEVVRAETGCFGLGAGNLFSLKEHPWSDLNREYLVTEMELICDIGDFEANNQAPARSRCFFSAIPSDTAYRPPRVTPRPVVSGPQPAVVVGASGEEIYTDAHGRVKVLFFWDRLSKGDEESSCWIRVAQGWAGKKWGAFYLPRVGQEVLVSFLEGDPDRPIITGSVYNADQAPPYALPAEKTKSTLKSSTSKGGAGFNEIRFEDKKGEEQIFIHAEKDVDIRVKNDVHEQLEHDRHLKIKNDQVEEVGNDRHEHIVRDQVSAVDRDLHLKVKGKQAIEITGSRSIKVTGDLIEEHGANHSTQVTKDLYIKAENIVLEATKNITINVGDSYIAIEADGIKIATNGEIVLDAKKNITQKATMDFIVEATKNASVKGTAALKLEGTTEAEMKGAQAKVSGDAMLTLKGGMVKIN